MSFFILYFNWLNLYILVIVGAIIYLGTLYLIKGISKEDLALIRQILKMPKN